tara:strand:+ start:3791 stop:6874 length:3084 start_codon:yes stop_codon:yes gene_type:complete
MWNGVRFGWVLAIVLMSVACAKGSGGTNAVPDDAGSGEDAQVLGSFGAPCSAPEECESEVCYDADGEGDAVGSCSMPCDDGCPSGFACNADDICVPASEFLCDSCASDDDCGGQGNRCIEYESGSYCAADCADDQASCPDGFSCEVITDGSSSQGLVCVSESNVCCLDADGDFRGEGDDCRATDCDESDADIYDDALELCDTKDNNCDGITDIDITDCEKADCRLGSNGYVMRADETCMDGECLDQAGVECGLYTCDGGGDLGDVCATSCDGEDDQKCSDPAHCDASLCEADYDDGIACDETSDCGGGHCQNNFCCEFGDCCQVASDCPSFGSFDPVCENPQTCQGSVGAAVCTAGNTCATTGTEQNDSACGAATVANECGFFLPVFCNGAIEQGTPACATTCTSDAQCDANAFCDDTNTCVEDLGNGQSCDSDSECQRGHCQNGFCCDSGDCCETAGDCPADYSTDPACTIASACQGQRDVAICTDSECGTISNSPDDSACTVATEADACGPYRSIVCSGGVNQDEPLCPTSCASNADCDANAYCNAQNQCEFDEVDGSACTGDSQCIGDHCENGFCCASGDCCADSTDCGHLASAAVCDEQTSCQGTRVDGVCGATFQCSATQVDDDSACAGLPSDDCGPFQGVSCNTNANQSSNQAGLCETFCSGDGDCDASAHCEAGSCVPDAGQGGFCDVQSDCGSGLVCVDNVCCGTTCAGSCEACDLPGSLGTCALVPDGQDPDTECGSVDCSGFYFGWEGDTCFEKAGVSAAGATCGGDNACGTTTEECAAQSARGPAQVTCDADCQEPNLASCSATSAGQCTNLDLGEETCGLGVCEVTMDRCDSGSPQSCVPNVGAATAETCDGADNNCNGSTDEGLPVDDYESNDTCGSNFFLGLLGEGLSETRNDMTLYTAGDEDWYRELTTEDFTTCTSGVDEEYQYTVTMTPPAGQDYDLELCYNSFTDTSCTTDCFTSLLGGDQTENITVTWAGPCGGVGNDGLNFFIRVHPYSGASSCEPYSLQTSFTKTN